MTQDELSQYITAQVSALKSDVFVFSGGIDERSAARFIDCVVEKAERKPRSCLFLTTGGGDPHAAFRMARCWRTYYQSTRLLVVGPCKSAGTLLAVGAHELALGPC